MSNNIRKLKAELRKAKKRIRVLDEISRVAVEVAVLSTRALAQRRIDDGCYDYARGM